MSRESRIVDQMELLGIVDVSTPRQRENDTRVWRLPIKYGPKKFVEVASFATGYVRNQNGGYSNYQLNKRCESKPQYYKLSNGDFREYTTRTCELIPNEIDRLEYLIGYCLKNYYIKLANQVTNGEYISSWEHEYEMEKAQDKMEEICHIDANHQFVINELQNKLANSIPKWKYDEAMELGSMQEYHYDRIQDLEKEVLNLQNKLETISRRLDVTKSIADNG